VVEGIVKPGDCFQAEITLGGLKGQIVFVYEG